MDQAFDPRFEFDKRTIFGDVGDGTGELRANRIFRHGGIPRIAFELLHAEADALRVLVDADDLHLDGVTDIDDFARVIDALVADVGDMQQAIDAAQIDERTIIGDVLDDAFDDLAFGEILDEAGALFGTGFFEDGAARNDDIAALAVHLQNDERLRDIHQRADIAHGADIDLAAGQEGHSTTKIDGETALDAAKDRRRQRGCQLQIRLREHPMRLRGGHGHGSALLRRSYFLRGRHKTSTSSPTFRSAFWPGIANSRRATRPSDFKPTSMTAWSLSIAVTVPFTTRPSKPPSAPPSDSSRSAAKSSRVGFGEVAILVRVSLTYILSGQSVGSDGL